MRGQILACILIGLAGVVRAASEEPRQVEPEILVLPPLKIREQSTSDFGLMLLSNRDAVASAKIEWLIVSRIMPGSGAAKAGLNPGDRILRVNGGAVSKLSTDRMLALFLRRKIGTRMQLEVQDPQTDMRRSVSLVCNEVHMERRPDARPAPDTPVQTQAP